MCGAFKAGWVIAFFIKKSKPHGVMRVGDRKSNRMMKQAPCRWQERFTEDDRSHRRQPQHSMPIIERLCPAADSSGKEALVVPGYFPVVCEPLNETRQGDLNIVPRLGSSVHARHHKAFPFSALATRKRSIF